MLGDNKEYQRLSKKKGESKCYLTVKDEHQACLLT
jgi:hypothetical protein